MREGVQLHSFLPVPLSSPPIPLRGSLCVCAEAISAFQSLPCPGVRSALQRLCTIVSSKGRRVTLANSCRSCLRAGPQPLLHLNRGFYHLFLFADRSTVREIACCLYPVQFSEPFSLQASFPWTLTSSLPSGVSFHGIEDFPAFSFPADHSAIRKIACCLSGPVS